MHARTRRQLHREVSETFRCRACLIRTNALVVERGRDNVKKSSTHPTRKLYTSELDLPDEHIKPFFDWYAYRHAPDIYQIGFKVCTSYRAVEGDMAIFDLYEINTVDVFDTAKYRAVSANDPYSATLLSHRRAKAHSVYAQLYVAPEPEDTRPLLDCDWIRVDRFNASDVNSEALLDYLDAGESERILLAGAKRVRLAMRTKAGPKHVSHRPPYIVLSEWTDKPAVSDIGDKLADHFGRGISDQSTFVGYRLYPWADRPDLLPADIEQRSA